jgi:4-hydroxythreonine-4-phosphate dehydrogenase
VTRPRPLAVTLGDPAGIGPEILIKAWSALKVGGPEFVVIGDRDTLVSAFPAGSAAVERVRDLSSGAEVFRRALPVLDPPRRGAFAAISAEHADAAAVIEWIETAVRLALAGEAAGVVTAPIAKSRLYDAGFRFPGHTEFLADLTAAAPHAGARGPVMMLTAKGLRVALVTIHTPLAAVAAELSTDKVIATARVVHDALRRDFGIAAPRLALAGLNPHAGEAGTIGREEIEVLGPAVARLRAEGIRITDPKPADTLFHEEARRGYDAAVCLYHDQALIPIKTLDFWGGVNVTLGLPIVRTSPDHGTGFDIAGRGVARADSLIAAIRLAAELAGRRAALAGAA